jgi:hypothetical protein
MRRNPSLLPFVLCAACCAATLGAAGEPTKGGKDDKPKPIPSSSELRDVAVRYFQSHFPQDYRDGDLITRESVAPLIAELQKRGVPLPDGPEILAKVLSSGDFLAVQFSTPKGLDFMRKIARYPNGYDLADRLSRMIRGQDRIRELIRGPDGYRMIEYMAAAPGGKNMGVMLGNAPRGKDFNQPTGRIYTAQQLLTRLEESRARSAAER